ncbi:MAG: sulfurtransferase TusA family protein [Desulfarculaceae bacterium]|nr:sulfurtransferase TusA family protein [Desulfarculaceae bacterium]
MGPHHEVDLNGVVAPLCLLQMKSALNRLNPGERLRVMVHDEGLIGMIGQIVSRSSDCIVEQRPSDDGISLIIQKGKRET